MSLDEGGRANFTDSNQTLIIQDIADKDQVDNKFRFVAL
jgi:hypothetical protein